MLNRKWSARNKNDLILEVWDELDCESVGAAELEQLQAVVREILGEGAVDSPALIARLLADRGAILRHPEVLEFDTVWRQRTFSFRDGEMDFASLEAAASSIKTLESIRANAKNRADDTELQRIMEFVSEEREELLITTASKVATRRQRAEAREILEWLSVWRRSPKLFADWLELRLISDEFNKAFPDFR